MPDDSGLLDYRRQLYENRERNAPYSRPGPRTFTTALPPEQEAQFRQWVQAKRIPFNPDEPAQDYDMRGFWLGLQNYDPKAVTAVDPFDKRMHFTDNWKTPAHETFSADSQYAGEQAPKWEGGRYLVDNSGLTLFDAAAPRGLSGAVGPRKR